MRAHLFGILAFLLAGIVAPVFSHAREMVHLNGYPSGTIVVRTDERRLYLILDGSQAIRYPVGVGRAGKAWSGTAYINGKYIKPRLVASYRNKARQALPARSYTGW
jgi:lipoprotein-anchoring transpeptidase ErfK/SrfK